MLSEVTLDPTQASSASSASSQLTKEQLNQHARALDALIPAKMRASTTQAGIAECDYVTPGHRRQQLKQLEDQLAINQHHHHLSVQPTCRTPMTPTDLTEEELTRMIRPLKSVGTKQPLEAATGTGIYRSLDVDIIDQLQFGDDESFPTGRSDPTCRCDADSTVYRDGQNRAVRRVSTQPIDSSTQPTGGSGSAR